MFDAVLKHILSLAITLVTLYVPKEKWLHKMETQPSPAERIARKDLKGWQYKTEVSGHTGQIHSYYYFPCADTSSNKTLLMLHGFNTDGAIFFNISPLSATHSLIAYNFPEKSDLYSGSIRDFEIIIDDFCALLHLDTIDLLGNSLGGIIAQFYTTHTGHVRVSNLILVSTYIHGATKDNIRQIQGMADKLLPMPDYKLFYLLTLGSRISDRLGKNREKDSALETVVIKQIPWYREVLKSMYRHDGTGDAARITCPVLVLHGKEDKLVPIAEMKATAELLTQARTMEFAAAGHTLVFSQADKVIAAIRMQLQ